MKKLRHPNIIRLFEIIDSPNSHKMYLGILIYVISYGICLKWLTY
jgi:hypothetical protein